MKSLVYLGPNTVTYRDEPEPVPMDGDVIVSVEAVGICGSDMHAYHGHDDRRPAPLILGHEAAGRVLTGALAGKRVTVNPLTVCGRCDFCLDGRSHLCAKRQIISMPPRPGAFAELIAIPEDNLVEIPDGFDIAKAALAEPMAVSYHAVNLGLRAMRRPGSSLRCAVLGGGAIGLCAALVLAAEGVAEIRICEPNAARRATAEGAGPFQAYEPGGKDEPQSNSVDLVIDAVGAEATRSAAFRMVKPGGAIVHIGLLPGGGGVDVRKLTLQEVTFVGTYCYTMTDFRETVAAMTGGRLGSLEWFEERPLSEGAAAFQAIDAGSARAAKVILRPR